MFTPSQPHFFKAIGPEFMDGIKIPASFTTFPGTRKGFSGEATLVTKDGRKWGVEIEDETFTEGWSIFARYNKLKCNDFVVFQLIGEMKFKVHVFDGVTQCGSFPDEQEESDDNIVLVSTSVQDNEVMKLDEGVAENPAASFSVEIQSSNLTHSMNVPSYFARRNGLCEKELLLLREKGKDWAVNLGVDKASGRTRMVSGWSSFAKAMGLEKGDHLKFELIENGQVPILRVTFVDV